MNKTNCVIYARVSSIGNRQDTKRQIKDLMNYAEKNNLSVIKIFEEKASGIKEDRAELLKCIDLLKKGDASMLLVSEISRLGRNLKQILTIIEELTKIKVNIFFLDFSLNTLQTNGKVDYIAKLLISLLGTFAEIEREQILYRLNSGRKQAISKGIKMGRPIGSKLTDKQFLKKHHNVVFRLNKNMSLRDCAGACNVSLATVQKVKKIMLKEYKAL